MRKTSRRTGPSAWRQLQGLLWKQYLLKRRCWLQTVLEIASPILLVSLLVLAFYSADPHYWPPRIRVLDSDLTLNELHSGVEAWALQHPLEHCQDLATNLTIFDGNATTSYSGGHGFVHTNLTALDEAHAAAMHTCRAELDTASPKAAKLVTDFLLHVFDRNGPLPIPTLDEFILVHELLQPALRGHRAFMSVLIQLQLTLGPHALGNLVDLGKVAFTPDTPEVQAFAQYMLESHRLFDRYFYGIFPGEGEAEAFMQSSPLRFWALVVFKSGPTINGSDYVIRMDYTALPSTGLRIDHHNRGVPSNAKQYLTSGFLSIQNAIEAYSLGLSASEESSFGPLPGRDGESKEMYTVWASVFPQAAYLHNNFYTAAGHLLGLIMSVSLIFPMSQLVRGFVGEKEAGFQDLMCVMGLRSPWLNLISWALTYSVIFSIVSFGLAALCYSSFFSATSFSLLLTMFMLFTFSEIAFALMVGTFFHNATLAAILAPAIHCAGVLPRYIFFRTEESQAMMGKILACVLSPSAFSVASDLAMLYEGGGNGLTWSALWLDRLPLGTIMLVMLANTFLYFGITYYMQMEQNGTNSAMCPFKLTYWQSLLMSRKESYKAKLENDEERMLTSMPQPTYSVQISDLSKRFSEVEAVKSISLELQVGELTSLLGHNGAGKSTLVGMMTGLLSPTAGDCLLLGKSIVKKKAEARRNLGYCPQRNVLYDRLTVREHLQLYGAIKGIQGGGFGKFTSLAVQQAIQALHLSGHTDTEARALSGGTKRKLQVALAILGDARILVLDEPSSGVDLASRQAFQEILSNIKSKHATILITQFTDEASKLSDKVAIMSEGEIISYGTPLETRRRYGSGLQLSVKFDRPSQDNVRHEAVASIVSSCFPEARMDQYTPSEIWVSLPQEEIGHLIPTVATLEQESSRLGICDISLTTPTLGDAFIRASTKGAPWQPCSWGPSKCSSEQTEKDCVDSPSSLGEKSKGRDREAGSRKLAHGWRCMKYIVWKRAIISRRDSRTILWAFLMPLVAICLVTFIMAWSVDPTAIPLVLKISSNQQSGPISTLSLPDALAPCNGTDLLSSNPACVGTLAFWDRGDHGNNDSVDMSSTLLWDLDHKGKKADIALVFNDIVIRKITAHKIFTSLLNLSLEAQKFSDRPLSRAVGLLLEPVVQEASGSKQIYNNKIMTKSGYDQTSDSNRTVTGFDKTRHLENVRDAVQNSQHLHVLDSLHKRLNSNAAVVNLLYNASSYHALPGAISGLHESIGVMCLNKTWPRFTAFNKPMPLGPREILEKDKAILILGALFTLIPFCLLTGAFCINVVGELSSGLLHIQWISGCPKLSFWLGNFAWDLQLHFALSVAAISLFSLLGNQVMTANFDQASGSLLLILLYGLAAIPQAYCMSMSFRSVPAAQVCVSIFAFITGAGAIIIVKVLSKLSRAAVVVDIMKKLLRISPSFLLGEGLLDLSEFYYKRTIAQALNNGVDRNSQDPALGSIYEWRRLGRPLTFMLAQSLGYSMLLIALDGSRIAKHLFHWSFQCKGLFGSAVEALVSKMAFRRSDDYRCSVLPPRMTGNGAKSRDQATKGESISSNIYSQGSDFAGIERGAQRAHASVNAEVWRCESQGVIQDPICLHHLSKIYWGTNSKVILQDVCLNLRPGDCLGLLGQNGSGKSTLMQILTGQSLPSSGQVLMQGASIELSLISSFEPGISFCPQEDPLSAHLTAREHLHLIGAFRGLASFKLSSAVNNVTRSLLLAEETSQRIASQYSGGTKRKLALGMSLMGLDSSSSLLLDEPSSGMDPIAKRAMWQNVSAATSRHIGYEGSLARGTLITTHSMEEAEALCNRIAILQGGRIACIGTPQELREWFSPGLRIEMEVISHADQHCQQEQLDNFLSKCRGKLLSRHGLCIQFAILDKNVSISSALSRMQNLTKSLSIRLCAISQATMEEIYVTVASGCDL